MFPIKYLVAMQMKRIGLLLSLGASLFLFCERVEAQASDSPIAKKDLKYCVGMEVNLDPFRAMIDPQELYYELLLTRSYISKNKDEPGLLESWYFSPNGKKFRAKISKKSKWNDGTQLSARDAALAIAKGLTFRPLGKKIRVVGTEHINDSDWKLRKYEGIKIISDDVFELSFQSEIENLTGVLKEALSSNSRHNRLWPVKIDIYEEKRRNHDVISKFPLKYDENGQVNIKAFGHTVKLVSEEKCKGADFFPSSRNFNESSELFSTRSSHFPQVVLAFVNTSKISNLSERRMVGSLIRDAVSKALSAPLERAHFREKEPGYIPKINWSDIDNVDVSSLKKIVVTSSSSMGQMHPFRSKIKRFFDSRKIKMTWVDTNVDDPAPPETDVIIWFSRLETDRQIWTQDILSYPTVSNFLKKSSSAFSALELIRQKSAATIPVDNVTLQSLELSSHDELSIIPISRLSKKVKSRKGLPIELAFTQQDEFTFLGVK
jgi:hypothetical protein